MKRLRDFEEWSAIQAIQPSIHHSLKIAYADQPSSKSGSLYLYFDSLEHLTYEIAQIPYLNARQPLFNDASIQDVKNHLDEILEVFEELAYKYLVLQLPIRSQVQDYSPITQPNLPESVLNKHPELRSLAHLIAFSGVSLPSFRVLHSQASKSVWDRAARTLKNAYVFFESLSQSSGPPIEETGTRNVNAEVADRIHESTGVILKSIQRKLSECQHDSRHGMLFAIPGLEAIGEKIAASHVDLLLKSCSRPQAETWQEASCHISLPCTNCVGLEHHLLRPLNNICNTITNCLTMSEHLHLTLEKQEIVHCELLDRKTGINETLFCRSLSDLLGDDYLRAAGVSRNRLTVWEKRTLALQLSYLLLHLYDCEWTANRWTASEVQLVFRSRDQKTPKSLPYLKYNIHGENGHEGDESKFIALAKLLVEIDIGQEIQVLDCENSQEPNLYLTIARILDRRLMTGYYHYTAAVEECLRLYREEHKGSILLGYRIFKKILWHLRFDLEMMEKPKRVTPLIPDHLVPVTSYATPATMSFGREATNYGQISSIVDVDTDIISDLPLGIPTISQGQVHTGSIVPQAGSPQHLRTLSNQRRSSGLAIRTIRKPPTAHVLLAANAQSSRVSKSRKQKSSTGYWKACVNFILAKGQQLQSSTRRKPTIRLFENFDTQIQDEHKKASAAEFLEAYGEFREHVLGNITLCPKIKVCIIDTGIDIRHPAIQAAQRSGALKERRSFMKESDDTEDNYGHGTHMVELILKSSENVEIYIAKIANRPDIPFDEIETIADAINHAVNEWKVDIITMSFGFRERNEEVNKAIKEAAYRGTLLFAAASNQGGNGPRTWPAKNRQVICVSASDGKGKDGGISPAALGNDDNFMTLGISVPLFWEGNRVYKSGTSYATPIAAGFAINMLEIHSSTPEAMELLKDCGSMRQIFGLFSSMDNGYTYVAPWILWDKCRNIDHMREKIASELQ